VGSADALSAPKQQESTFITWKPQRGLTVSSALAVLTRSGSELQVWLREDDKSRARFGAEQRTQWEKEVSGGYVGSAKACATASASLSSSGSDRNITTAYRAQTAVIAVWQS
jgi:hypothetical protein